MGSETASSGRCTRSTRCAWTGSTRIAPLHGKRVLDVGCGGGILAESMARRGADVLGIDLASKPLKRGAAARARGRRAATRVPRGRGRSARGRACRERSTSSPAWRCSSTCPTRRRSVRACAALVRPGGWVFFSTINRNAKAFVFAIVGAEHVLQLLPKGTHEYAQVHPPERARRAGAATPALELRRHARHGIQPAHRRYRLSGDTSVNYLLACREAAHERPRDAATARAVRSRRHPDRQRARPRRRRATTCARARACRRCRSRALRPMVGAGARGMVGVAFGVDAGRCRLRRLRDAFLRALRARMLRETARVRRHAAGAAVAGSSRRALGHRHQQGDAVHRAARRGAGLRTRRAALVCGDTTPHSKPHPAPLLEAARHSASTAADCVYVGDDLRDVEAGRAAGMATLVAALGLPRQRRRRSTDGAPTRVLPASPPTTLLNWLRLA